MAVDVGSLPGGHPSTHGRRNIPQGRIVLHESKRPGERVQPDAQRDRRARARYQGRVVSMPRQLLRKLSPERAARDAAGHRVGACWVSLCERGPESSKITRNETTMKHDWRKLTPAG